MYPETVGRSLEEVEEIFQQGHVFSAWAIGRNIGVKTLDQVVSDNVSIHSCIERDTTFIILFSAQRLAFTRRRKGRKEYVVIKYFSRVWWRLCGLVMSILRGKNQVKGKRLIKVWMRHCFFWRCLLWLRPFKFLMCLMSADAEVIWSQGHVDM